MPHPEFNPEHFRVLLDWPVQWGDQDLFGHVNNTVYFRWFETARVDYLNRIGLARLQIFLDQDISGFAFDDETGGAVTGAAGIEVARSYNWALDLQVRGGHAFYNGGDLNNLAFMVGITWY